MAVGSHRQENCRTAQFVVTRLTPSGILVLVLFGVGQGIRASGILVLVLFGVGQGIRADKTR